MTATEPSHVPRVIATGRGRTAAPGRGSLQHHGHVVEGRSDRRRGGRLRFGSVRGQRQRAQGSYRYSVICGEKNNENMKHII